jgi:hypothetical protein
VEKKMSMNLAGTDNNIGASYTAGVLMHSCHDGQFVIEHIARDQWSALEREQRIKTICFADAASWLV